MILSNILIQIGIVAGSVVLFLVTFILNRRTKAPKIDDKIEKCSTCTNTSCVIKLSEIEDIKLEYEQELKKHEGENKIVEAINKCQEEEKNEK